MNTRRFRQFRVVLVYALVFSISTGPAFAGRGGGGGGRGFSGGGGRGFSGGGGGFRGGGMPSGVFRPSGGGGMAHNPSFNMGGGGYRPPMNSGNFNRGNINTGNINRGNINTGNINRGNINTGNINRGNINTGNINRGNINTGNINRGNINTGNINRGNINTANINRGNFNNNNFNRVNVNNFGGGGWGYGRGYGPTRYSGGWGAGYYGGRYGPGYWAGYHNGWYNGYWNNHWGAFGVGVGVGMLGWGLGSSIYNWGYSSYANPYYFPQTTVVVQQPGVNFVPTSYDYSQPINTETEPPAQEVIDSATQAFDDARSLFKANDYQNALVKIDTVLKQTPSDSAAHEFRALILFAHKNYDLAAATLYAVLSVGPGWDWSTMVGLYPDVDTYTAQLRALEDFCRANPSNAAAIFVLGYQYLTTGQPDAAKPMFERVVKLKPTDKLAAALFAKLSAPPIDPNAPPTEPPKPIASAYKAEAKDLTGTWKAQPTADVSISITFTADGKFTWVVDQKGKTNTIAGESTLGNDILTLASSNEGSVMVGNTNWADANHFNFKIANGPSDDPGLSLVKQ